MRALRIQTGFMASIVFAGLILVPVLCSAQGNEECADLKVVPKIPGSSILSCDKGDSIEIVLPLAPDDQGVVREKTVRGHYEFREYKSSYAQQEQAFEDLVRLLPIAGSTVKYKEEPSTITARNGYTWILINVMGESYDVKTVLAAEDPWAPVRDAKEISREMQTHNRVALYGITFSPENAAVVEENSKILGEVLTYLKGNPATIVDIESHKMSTNGTAEDDQEITRKRAAAVIAWLVAHGIPAEHLRAKPLGRTKPITENDTPLEILRNERIELVQAAP
jgi:outer membrane protein OmpA-like peptidoglycan-associated protein